MLAAVLAWLGRSEVIAGQLDVGPDKTVIPGSDPVSQFVAGSAPMKQNKPEHGWALRGVRHTVGDGTGLNPPRPSIMQARRT